MVIKVIMNLNIEFMKLERRFLYFSLKSGDDLMPTYIGVYL
jgi:hypothetical protein